MAIAALVIIGIILVILGIFGANLPLIGIGVFALVVAGGYEVVAARRT